MSHRRDLTTSEWFHIVHKGADSQDIFAAASHRSVYEDLLADAFERFGVELHAYAWMSNHVHQLVHVPNGALPEAMHRLASRYACIFNGWTDRSGPLFTDRYFSEPITSDAQLAQTARYIHRNPSAIVGSAGLVPYRWSSFGVLAGRRPAPSWLTTGVVDAGFTPSSYERYVLTPQPSDRHALGVLPPSTPTSCDELEAAVAEIASRSIDDLRRRETQRKRRCPDRDDLARGRAPGSDERRTRRAVRVERSAQRATDCPAREGPGNRLGFIRPAARSRH